MTVGVVVPLVLLAALIVAGALIVRRMGRIVATDRVLRAYLDGLADLRRAADPALEQGAAAVDALLRGHDTAGAAAAEVAAATADLARARDRLASREVPADMAALDGSLDGALDAAASALAVVQRALGRLGPGTARDDPERLAAERDAKRGRLGALEAREEIAALEARISTAVAEARERTQWRWPARA